MTDTRELIEMVRTRHSQYGPDSPEMQLADALESAEANLAKAVDGLRAALHATKDKYPGTMMIIIAETLAEIRADSVAIAIRAGEYER